MHASSGPNTNGFDVFIPLPITLTMLKSMLACSPICTVLCHGCTLNNAVGWETTLDAKLLTMYLFAVLNRTSASTNTNTSFSAASAPTQHACAFPAHPSGSAPAEITFAPASCASCSVLSVDPSSTTTISSMVRICCRNSSINNTMLCASFLAGIITLIAGGCESCDCTTNGCTERINTHPHIQHTPNIASPSITAPS